NSGLFRRELVAAHAVVLLDHPPAFLNIAPRIPWLVLITRGQGTLLAAQQERGQVLNLQFREMQVRHAEDFCLRLDLALVVDIWFGELVLEESLAVVPWICGPSLRQTCQVFGIGDGFGMLSAALRNFREQSE